MIELIILMVLLYFFRSSFSNLQDEDVEDFMVHEYFADDENF